MLAPLGRARGDKAIGPPSWSWRDADRRIEGSARLPGRPARRRLAVMQAGAWMVESQRLS
jgi:hypothetical protein